MSMLNLPEKAPVCPEVAYDISRLAPRTMELFHKIVPNTGNQALDGAKLRALTIARHPDPSCQDNLVYIPLAESLREQFQAMSDPNFFTNLRTSGFIFSLDGIGIQSIDLDPDLGPAIADAVIVGNFEIIIQTCHNLGWSTLYNRYSGDENTGLVAPPSGNSGENQHLFAAEAAKVRTAYYQDKYFAALRIKQAEPGFRLATADTKEAYIYKPKHRDGTSHTLHLTSLVGASIDSTKHAHVPAENTRTYLVDELERVLTSSRSNFKQDFDQLKIYTLLTNYESIFPRFLQVRKISSFEQYLHSYFSCNQGKNLKCISLADINLKGDNDKSHTLGDFNLIATMNIVQNYFQANNIEPHSGIAYFQHNGSFLLVIEEQYFQAVSRLLSDPLAINAEIYSHETRREPLQDQDPFYRANPFIVATPLIYPDHTGIPATFNQEISSQEIWGIVNQLKIDQHINEILCSTYASGLGVETLQLAIEALENALREHGFLPKNSYGRDFLNSLTPIAKNYQEHRPNLLARLTDKIAPCIHDTIQKIQESTPTPRHKPRPHSL